METIQRLVETNELRTSLWAKHVEEDSIQPSLFYNPIVDALTLLIIHKKGRRIVNYVDDHVALLYTPDEKEVIGLRIEGFKRAFLPKYADLNEAWSLSNKGRNLQDLGDLMIIVHKREPVLVKELSRITESIVKSKGIDLPVPA
jgi:hypothetical protein